MKKLIFLFLITSQVAMAQNIPNIQQARINTSQGYVHGFVLFLPGVGINLAREIWIAYTNNLLAPNQPGVGHPRVPVTTNESPEDNQFKTSGIFLPQISDHFLDAYITLDSVSANRDSLFVNPTTRFSVAFDLGNKHFSNSDDGENGDKITKVLLKFYERVVETLAFEEKNKDRN